MAVRLVARHRHRYLRVYLPGLQVVVQRCRKFSSHDESAAYLADEPDISQVVWPESALGPLCIKDRRFPLPGNVGILHELQPIQQARVPPVSFEDALVTLPAQPEERHFGVLANYFVHDSHLKFDMEEFLPEEDTPKASDMLECAAYDCPQILRKDFADLFPDRNTMEGPFTVITLAQHTQNDMTMWSDEVEKEREALFETFMQGAVEICNLLSKKGFWANFIDPMNGKPFRGPHTNATLLETDERYRKLGFQIEDLGCCKVIRHPIWGTHAFVSCLFTNAPVNHPLIAQIVKPEDNK